MILYGRNLSPFARRVALWCACQGRELERRELTVAGDDFVEIARHNPVARVPILILDEGTHLIETFAICDYLDETAPVGTRLLPESGTARIDALQRLAVANSTAEKAVAMVYDRNRRPAELHWQAWQDRLTGQIQGGLAALEKMAPDAARGGRPDGGDLATVIAYHFIEETNPWLLDPDYPELAALAGRAMDWPGVRETMPKA
ncbi:MAG: glutathione S-transferase family protein [Pseudomonadota bacterium]